VFRVLGIYNFEASLTRKSRSAEGEVSHAEETQEIGDNVEEVFPYLLGI
jgi:hypothetical protein